MYVSFQELIAELQRSAQVQAYNVNGDQIVTNIQMLPVDFTPEQSDQLKDTLYICEYWQFKRFDPRAELPLIVCVMEAHADANAVMFQNRSMAVVYGSTVVDVLLALTNAVYDLGCKSSLITELSRTFLQCKSLEELMLEGYRALKNPLIVTDHNQKILYYTDPGRVSSPVYRTILASEYIPVGHPLIGELSNSWNAVDTLFLTSETQDLFPILCKPLTVGTATVGYLHIMQFEHRFDEQDGNIAELLGNLLTIELWRTHRSNSRAGQTLTERFLRDILDSLLGDQEAVNARQKELGLTFQPHLCAMVFNLRQASSIDSVHHISFSDMAALIQNTLPGTTAFLYKNSVFVLAQSAAAFNDMAAFLAPVLPSVQQYNLIIGVSNELPSISFLREAGYQARKALQLGEVIRPGQLYYRYADYTLHYMMELCLKGEDLGALCPPGLHKLVAYGQENGPELMDTLRIYLLCGRSKAETAKKLFVHVNTVKYRISQIQEITNLDLNDGETALSLLLAFKMIEYREKFQSYEPIINE
jgi:sugar diacid utilization regulator